MTGQRRWDETALRRLTVDTDPWLSCDDCFDRIDTVVERLLAGASPLDEAFRAHLLGCPVCREEAEALVTLVAPEHGLHPAAALRILDEQVESAARASGRR